MKCKYLKRIDYEVYTDGVLVAIEHSKKVAKDIGKHESTKYNVQLVQVFPVKYVIKTKKGTPKYVYNKMFPECNRDI